MNYDPNLTLGGKCAIQHVRLTFALWEYRAEVKVPVCGNCRGLSIIRSAISSAYDKLPEDDADTPYISMCREGKDGALLTSKFYDEEHEGEEWLEDMCIDAEIISIEAETPEARAALIV